MIKVTTGDTGLSALRADPPDPAKGAVVVLVDATGQASDAEALVSAFAAKGYVAIAPQLANSPPPAPPEGEAPANGSETPKASGRESALAHIQAAVDSVKLAGKVAIVGYRGGGDLAYAAANRVAGVSCVVAHDGAGIVHEYREKRRIPTLLHFAEDDPALTAEAVTQFRARRPDVSAFTYSGARQSLSLTEPDLEFGAASGAAMQRTLFWISQFVVGLPPIQLKNAGAYAQAKTEKKKKKKDDNLGPPLD